MSISNESTGEKGLDILRDSLRQLHETEKMAKETATQLSIQKEMIKKNKSAIQNSNDELSQSKRLVSRINRRESCVIQ